MTQQRSMGRPPSLRAGDERGTWRVTGQAEQRFHGQLVYTVECIRCGAEREMPSTSLPRVKCVCQGRAPDKCKACGRYGHRAAWCPGAEAEVFDARLPWEQDLETRVLVAIWGPMSLAEVGDLWDISRERIRQIERDALRKLWAACTRAGLRPEDVLGDGRKGEAWAEAEQHAILSSGPRAASEGEAA